MSGPEQAPTPGRMERTLHRFQHHVLEGIAAAESEGREIDLATARMIAHILGKALGRESALAEFGRTGEGEYQALREEYLALYVDETTPPPVKEWINWFGTYLIQQQGSGSGRQFMGEVAAPQLDRVLVRTTLDLGGRPLIVHVPATFDDAAIARLREQLITIDFERGRAFEAFRSLPDVNAGDPAVLASFSDCYLANYQSKREALLELTELESWRSAIEELSETYGGIPDEAVDVTIDWDAIEAHVRGAYDLVELDGRTFVFTK